MPSKVWVWAPQTSCSSPSQAKTNILLIFWRCGVVCLLRFCHKCGVFTSFPKPPQTSLEPCGSCCLSITEQRLKRFQCSRCPLALPQLWTVSVSERTLPGWDRWAAVNKFSEPDGSHDGWDSAKKIKVKVRIENLYKFPGMTYLVLQNPS